MPAVAPRLLRSTACVEGGNVVYGVYTVCSLPFFSRQAFPQRPGRGGCKSHVVCRLEGRGKGTAGNVALLTISYIGYIVGGAAAGGGRRFCLTLAGRRKGGV